MKTNTNPPKKAINLNSSKQSFKHIVSNYSPSKYNPFQISKRVSPPHSPTRRTKTATAQEINQLAQRHYNQAMRYVYKKNQQQQKVKQKQKNKSRLDKQLLTEQHTFMPNLFPNKYSKKIQQMKGNSKRYTELTKWGAQNTVVRRQQVLQKQIKTIRKSLQKSLQKQCRSLQNSRTSSLDKNSLQKTFQSSIKIIQNQPKTQQIPGVRKFYLNQTKAQVSKHRNQKLLFKGNQITGFYF